MQEVHLNRTPASEYETSLLQSTTEIKAASLQITYKKFTKMPTLFFFLLSKLQMPE